MAYVWGGILYTDQTLRKVLSVKSHFGFPRMRFVLSIALKRRGFMRTFLKWNQSRKRKWNSVKSLSRHKNKHLKLRLVNPIKMKLHQPGRLILTKAQEITPSL